MTVSIIIAVATWQENLARCVKECQGIDFPDFEIIILPDEPFLKNPVSAVPLSVIPTGALRPAAKRDMALKAARGEILAFLDDDAYPARDWLKNAMKNFQDNLVAAVGGPAVTPPEDSLRQKASGAVYSSPLVSGKYVYRYTPKLKGSVDDYPSCNFLVRAAVMRALKGFNTDFWPGEDTKLCLDIKKRGLLIIYDPEVLVYHHRRRLFLPHLAQISSYAMHRGYFVKRFPETSLRIPYFIPTFFLACVLFGAAPAIFSSLAGKAYLAAWTIYLACVFAVSVSAGLKSGNSIPKISQKVSLIALVFAGIICTHLTYGLYFAGGLWSHKLKEEKTRKP